MREVITLDLKKACSRGQLFRLWQEFYAQRAKNPNERRYVLSAMDNAEQPLEVWAVVDDGDGEERATLRLPEDD